MPRPARMTTAPCAGLARPRSGQRAGGIGTAAPIVASVRIAVLGDVHLIAGRDPRPHYHRIRAPFEAGVPAFRRLLRWIDGLGVDAVFSVGDLVDWHSPENLALAAECMGALRRPWYLTPGNHDLEVPEDVAGSDAYRNQHADANRAACIAAWRAHGIELGNRRVALDGLDVLLVDSASSRIDADDARWVRENAVGRSILLTHVPLDRPRVREYILGVDPHRHLGKYVQAGSPGFFAEAVEGRIEAVLTGHLHFPGTVVDGGTTCHLLDASFARGDGPPTVALVELRGGRVHVEAVAAGS